MANKYCLTIRYRDGSSGHIFTDEPLNKLDHLWDDETFVEAFIEPNDKTKQYRCPHCVCRLVPSKNPISNHYDCPDCGRLWIIIEGEDNA